MGYQMVTRPVTVRDPEMSVMNKTYLDANISKTVEDRGSMPMGHQ